MSLSLFSRIASGARRLETDFVQILESRGIDPSTRLLPPSQPTLSLTLDLPPSIDGELVALGYPESLSRQISDTYISGARNLRDSCSARCHKMCTSLSTIATPVPGWQSKVEQVAKLQYMADIHELHQNILRNLRKNVRDVSGRDVRSIDRPFDYRHRALLETSFEANCTPSAAERELLAKKTGMTVRQIEHWFQNKRHRTRKIGIDATGAPMWDMEDKHHSGSRFVREMSQSTDSDEESELELETVYESTSEDGLALHSPPRPHSRKHAFDSPVPCFAFPAKYPPPRKHRANLVFAAPVWPRQRSQYPRTRIAQVTVDQLADEFASLSVKPKLVKEMALKRPDSTLNSKRRTKPPTQRPDRRAATHGYMIFPVIPVVARPSRSRASRRAPRMRFGTKPSSYATSTEALAFTSPDLQVRTYLINPQSSDLASWSGGVADIHVMDDAWREPASPVAEPSVRIRKIRIPTPVSRASSVLSVSSPTTPTTPTTPVSAGLSRKRIRVEEAEVEPIWSKRPRTNEARSKPSLPSRRPKHAPVINRASSVVSSPGWDDYTIDRRSATPPIRSGSPAYPLDLLPSRRELHLRRPSSMSSMGSLTVSDASSPEDTFSPITPPRHYIDLTRSRSSSRGPSSEHVHAHTWTREEVDDVQQQLGYVPALDEFTASPDFVKTFDDDMVTTPRASTFATAYAT